MHSPQRVLTFADSPYVVLDSDRLLKVDCSGGPVEVDLPAASARPSKTFEIIKTDSSSNGVVLTPLGGALINGAATLTFTTQWQLVGVTSDGTDYLGIYGAIGTGGGGGGGAVGDIVDDTGTTADAYATIVNVSHAVGLIGIGSIKNTDGADSLTVKETVTDKFGVTTVIETPVSVADGNYILDPQTNFDDGVNPVSLPPFISYKVEIKSTTPGSPADYELHFIDIIPTASSGGGGSSDFEMSFSGTLSTTQDNLIPVKTKKTDVDVDQIDVELQEASAGQDVHVELFSGVTSLGTCVVAAGALSGTLAIALTTIPANTRVTGKIRQVGTTTIAITASIFLRAA